VIPAALSTAIIAMFMAGLLMFLGLAFPD